MQEDIDQMEYRATEESSNNFNAVSFSSLDNVKLYCAGAGNILEMVGKSIEGNIKQAKVVFDFTTYCSYVSDALFPVENVDCVSVSELSWSGLLEKIVNPKLFSLLSKFSFKHYIVRVKGFGEYQFVVPEYRAGEK